MLALVAALEGQVFVLADAFDDVGADRFLELVGRKVCAIDVCREVPRVATRREDADLVVMNFVCLHGALPDQLEAGNWSIQSTAPFARLKGAVTDEYRWMPVGVSSTD